MKCSMTGQEKVAF